MLQLKQNYFYRKKTQLSIHQISKWLQEKRYITKRNQKSLNVQNKKKSKRISKTNKKILQEFFFNINRMPTIFELKKIQIMTSLSEKIIEFWFRAKIRTLNLSF